MTKAFETFITDSNEPIPQSQSASPNQKLNAAGGYTFVVSDLNRLERFLILGTTGGTYYTGEKDLTKENAEFLIKMIQNDSKRVISTLLDVSKNGRAAKQSPAIFTMAMLFKHAPNNGAKTHVQSIFNNVVRTSTHLFEFAKYVELLGVGSAEAKDLIKGKRKSGSPTGGWGRAKRKAVAGWYTGKSTKSLAYQAVKYRQRDGWTHKDLLRLSHPKGVDRVVGDFILGKQFNESETGPATVAPSVIRGFVLAQNSTTVPSILETLDSFPDLPWEALPTQFLKSPEVWKKLFYNGQLNGQALVRNITRLARIKAFDDMSFTRDYADRLVDVEMITNTRLHPINYLNALVVHQEGQIDRRSKSLFGYSVGARKKDWQTNAMIVDALDAGFVKAFSSIEPAQKRTMVGLDVSGSMSMYAATGVDLSAAQVGAVLSMVVARTEPMYQIHGFSTTFRDLGISGSDSLYSVIKKTECMVFGGTDMALPMRYATEHNLAVDTFQVITDNETWYGDMHPHVALEQYRQRFGIPAKLVVMSVTATESTIGDVDDPGTLDVVGFDSGAPKVVADFSAGRI